MVLHPENTPASWRSGGDSPTLPLFDLNAKLLQLVQECLPTARRLAMVIDPLSPTSRRLGSHLQESARPMGIEVDVIEVGNTEDLERQAHTMKRRMTDAVWFVTTTVNPSHPSVVEFAIRHRIPTIHESQLAVHAGGLMSYGESDLVRARRIARYVGRILQGARPRDLPVEQSTYLQLAINLKPPRRSA